MIEYKEQAFDDVQDQILALAEQHYVETELYHDRIPLNPDLNMYRAGNEAGMVKFYTARSEDELVGYIVVMLAYKPHCKDSLYALTDMLYVHPDHRHTELAADLLEFAESEVREAGAEVFTIGMKTHVPFVGLMQSLGFDKAELTFTKYIKEQ